MVIEAALEQEVVLRGRVPLDDGVQPHGAHFLAVHFHPARWGTQPLSEIGDVGNRGGHADEAYAGYWKLREGAALREHATEIVAILVIVPYARERCQFDC